MTRIVFCDTETTHLDPQVGHIWELAIIVRDPGEGDVEHLWQVRPDLIGADPNALSVGRFYERLHWQLRENPVVDLAARFKDGKDDGLTNASDVAAFVASMLNGAVLVGQNVQFDAAHLTTFLRRNGQAYTAHYRPVCVTTMAAGFLYGLKAAADAYADDHGGERDATAAAGSVEALPWSSRDLARAVSVVPDDFDTHTALGDARLARHIWDCVVQDGAS